jgi:hypothetical protein
MATSARPAAAVTPTATAVFQRPPPARGPPRRPAATGSTQPHAHIGRRCPPDRSTAPLLCYYPRRRWCPRSKNSGLPVTFSFLLSGGITEISRKWCVAACRASPTGRVRGLHGLTSTGRSVATRRGLLGSGSVGRHQPTTAHQECSLAVSVT